MQTVVAHWKTKRELKTNPECASLWGSHRQSLEAHVWWETKDTCRRTHDFLGIRTQEAQHGISFFACIRTTSKHLYNDLAKAIRRWSKKNTRTKPDTKQQKEGEGPLSGSPQKLAPFHQWVYFVKVHHFSQAHSTALNSLESEPLSAADSLPALTIAFLQWPSAHRQIALCSDSERSTPTIQFPCVVVKSVANPCQSLQLLLESVLFFCNEDSIASRLLPDRSTN